MDGRNQFAFHPRGLNHAAMPISAGDNGRRYVNSSMPPHFEHLVDKLQRESIPPCPPNPYPPALVPVGDREAILAYRSRVNGNSNDDSELAREMQKPEVLPQSWPSPRSSLRQHASPFGSNPNSSFLRDDPYCPLPPDKSLRKRPRLDSEIGHGDHFQRRNEFPESELGNFSKDYHRPVPFSPQYDAGSASGPGQGLGPSSFINSPLRHKWQQHNRRREHDDFFDVGEIRKLVAHQRDVVRPSQCFRDDYAGRDLDVRNLHHSSQVPASNDLRMFLDETNRFSSSRQRIMTDDVGANAVLEKFGIQDAREYLPSSPSADVRQAGKKGTDVHTNDGKPGIQSKKGIWISELENKQVSPVGWRTRNKGKNKRKKGTRASDNVVVTAKDNKIAHNASSHAHVMNVGNLPGNRFPTFSETGSGSLSVTFKTSGMVAQEVFASRPFNKVDHTVNSQNSKLIDRSQPSIITSNDGASKNEVAVTHADGVLTHADGVSKINTTSHLKKDHFGIVSENMVVGKLQGLEENSSDSSYVEEIDNKIIVSSGQSKDKSQVSAAKQTSTENRDATKDKPSILAALALETVTQAISESTEIAKSAVSSQTASAANTKGTDSSSAPSMKEALQVSSTERKIHKKKKTEEKVVVSAKSQKTGDLPTNLKSAPECSHPVEKGPQNADLLPNLKFSPEGFPHVNKPTENAASVSNMKSTPQASISVISDNSHKFSDPLDVHNSQVNENSRQMNKGPTSLCEVERPFCPPPLAAKGVSTSAKAQRSRTSWHRTTNVDRSSMVYRRNVSSDNNTDNINVELSAEKCKPPTYVRKGNSLVRTSSPSMLPVTTVGPISALKAEQKVIKKEGIRLSKNNTNKQNDISGSKMSPVPSPSIWSSTSSEYTVPSLEKPDTAPMSTTNSFQFTDSSTEVPAYSSFAKVSMARQSSPAVLAVPESNKSNTVEFVDTHDTNVVQQNEKNFGISSGWNWLKSNAEEININIHDEKPPEKMLVVEGFNNGGEKVVSAANKTSQNEAKNSQANCQLDKKSGTVELRVEQAKMAYLKPKSNQLIAASASNLFSSTTPTGDSVQSHSSSLQQDQYYKRKKNQLVRSGLALDSKIKAEAERNEVAVPLSKSQQYVQSMQSTLHRVLKHKKFKFQSPRVWTLNEPQSSSLSSVPSEMVAHLLPWKRGLFGRLVPSGHIKAVPNFKKGSALSLISKKLKRLHKRDTVYTRSRDGFSLRRSGVLSLGGSSLKWTKSLEKQSKEANEEATIAVAAMEKKKREGKVASDTPSVAAKAKALSYLAKVDTGMKSRSSKLQESKGCIVRVGLFRYKMDPSKLTLNRISDKEDPQSVDGMSERKGSDPSKRVTPKRVNVGGNQYLRVGNGNKLVRDPKSVSRALASEKVRWSLHTARCRLAKKQQYCQFYTRFGKCNKEDGKCPYIHDREKVAVCTKFLKGICNNPNCELTHKVIPERMEDCSYFLKGLCTNENCAYRHVNVNPKAPVCSGFLKGYCVEGDKCNKRHTYVCPQFAETGECKERSSCKLRHPKKKDKPKASSVQNSSNWTKRRYFLAGESASALASLYAQQEMLEKSLFPTESLDFISINASVEETEANDFIRGVLDPLKAVMSDSCGIDSFVGDLDVLIKPVLLIQKEHGVGSSTEQETSDRHSCDSSCMELNQ